MIRAGNMQNIEEIATLQNPPRRTPPRRRIAAACEACKRRKERCNGSQPCGRCAERGVERDCFYTRRKNDGANSTQQRSGRMHSTTGAVWSPYGPPRHNLESAISPATSEHYSRLIRDRKGSFMFIGDSANLSFLQIIRRVASDCLGSCPLVDDPIRHNMVEASPEGQPSWLNEEARQEPAISLLVAQDLIRNYILAVNCILDLFDEAELLEHSQARMERQSEGRLVPDAIYFLMLALGAQTSAENQDDLADNLFAHARYLTAVHFVEDANISTVSANALITMYLLGACRRNAAFMYLGMAVRAAYAIGLHRREISTTFTRAEFVKRERLWRAIRTLDLFMCASLGRPPSTYETRDTEANEDYSASNNLCVIFEKILVDVYLRRMISTEALSSIGSHHRRWAWRFFRGIESDKLEYPQDLEDGAQLDIGLMHVKATYYWSIILLTRPFLVESVTLHIKRAESSSNPPSQPCTISDPNKVLINACVDSAIRILDLAKGLLQHQQLPRRLPFLVNSIFIGALVLGFAHFGDLDQSFPLQRRLRDAQHLLALFSHDVVAQRNASIIGHLCDAAEPYQEKRTAQNMDYQSLAVGSMFGQIHRMQRTQAPSGRESVSGSDEADDGPEVQTTESSNDAQTNINLTSQSLPEQVTGSQEDYRYTFDMQQEFSFPPMTPRTLWFDALDGNMPLFSTISDSSAQYSGMPGYD